MAMFLIARDALRRSLAATPRAASLGAVLRRAKEELSSRRRILNGQLLPCLFSTDASGSDGTWSKISKDDRIQDHHRNLVESILSAQYFPTLGVEVDPDLEMEYKRRYDEKRRELIRSLMKALDTCEPAHRNCVIEKHREVLQVRQEFLDTAHVSGQKMHNTNNDATRSKKAAEQKEYLSFVDLLSIAAWSIFLGLILSELESRLRA